jgi:hypothetical protein
MFDIQNAGYSVAILILILIIFKLIRQIRKESSGWKIDL